MRRAFPRLSSNSLRRLSSNTTSSQQGFTLLELTIAMLFVGLVASGIALSISTCLNVWRRATEAADINQEARAVLELLSRDLRATYLGLDGKTGYLVGEGPRKRKAPVDSLEISTQSTSPDRLARLPDEMRPEWDDEFRPPVTDYVVVRYEWLERGRQRPAGLYRTTWVIPVAEPEEEEIEHFMGEMSFELVSTSVAELRYQYYDGREEAWSTSWDTRALEGHPLWAVWIELTLRDTRERDHVFETMVPIAAQ